MMKKMNSFGPSSPPTAANQTAESVNSPPAVPSGKTKPAKLGKQLSKSSSISNKDSEQQQPKEETPEERFKKFEDEGVTFKAKLIGSELVMEPRGDKMCQNSIQRLKAIIKGQKVHKQRIVMKISYSGVRVYDEKTNEVLYHHEVPQISFIASDDSDSRTFGYVCDVPNKAHQFICFKTNGPALQVMSVISSLFEAVLEKKKQAEGGNSATANSEKDEAKSPSTSQDGSGKKAEQSKSPFDDDFGKSDSKNTSDLISGNAESSQTENNNELGRNDRNRRGENDGDEFITIKTSGSKKDIRSYFDDLKDLQITKVDQSPPFHLIHSGVGGDSGIMDTTNFSGEWGVLSSGMSRTNSAAQMSRTESGGGLSRTNSAAGGFLFEAAGANSGGQPGGAQVPTSLFFSAPTSQATSVTSPMSQFNTSSTPLELPNHHHHLQQQQSQQQASQAMFIPGRVPGQFPTPSMMVPNQSQQQSQQANQHHFQLGSSNTSNGAANQIPASGPNAASFGSFFEPPHSNMIVGSAPMNQMSHHQMSQHARFSSSMVAGLHQRLGSSAASIQSTGSAGGLSRQTNPFDDDFFAS